MFCQNCGNQLDKNATICNNCGQAINHQQGKTRKFNLPSKKIIMILLFLIILVSAFFVVSYFLKGNSKQQEAVAYFDSNKPIRVKSNSLYGYIDSNGKVIAEPQYKEAGQFYDKYAMVKLSSENEYYALIDQKGKIVFTTTTTYSSSIEYISEYETWLIQGKIYDKNLKLKTPETTSIDYLDNGYFEFSDSTTKEVGIMSANGKKTYSYPTNGKYVYLSADISKKEYADLKDDYCVINIDNSKYGVINCKTGKVVYEFSEKYITEKRNNIFEIKNKDDYSLIEVIYLKNDKVEYRSSANIRLEYIGNHILEIRDNDYKYTYYDVVNKKNVDQKPNSADVEDVWELLTSFKKVKCDEGGYAIKKDDKIIVPCGWDNIEFVADPLYTYADKRGKQLIYVKKDGKMSIYDIKSNKVISNFNASYISGNYGDSIFIYYRDSDTKKTIVYNVINGKQQEFDEGVSISNESNYFTVKKDNKIEYYNTNFKLIYTGSVS